MFRDSVILHSAAAGKNNRERIAPTLATLPTEGIALGRIAKFQYGQDLYSVSFTAETNEQRVAFLDAAATTARKSLR